MSIAPGWPGIPPRWTSSAKSGVGTALGAGSRVWFTLSHGILNEVYYPRLDQACLRDLGLIVTDGRSFFSEEKRDATSTCSWMAPGVPAFRIVNTCKRGRYQITKEILADPRRDVILQQTTFAPLVGALADYRVHVLVAPHLGNHGSGNTAWTGDYNGVPMLFAERNGIALAVACTPAWRTATAGYVGFSDGWQDLIRHYALTWIYDRADDGNVALTGEVDIASGNGTFLVALAFGSSSFEAGHRARASLLDGFNRSRDAYLAEWADWQRRIDMVGGFTCDGSELGRGSAAIVRCHEEKRLPGAIIASLSIPWGSEKGDEDLGGYHLVWPRDLVETAGALLAAGAREDACRIAEYLRTTQLADGWWPQNMWVDGEPYWHGIQLDETAFPILLLDLLRRDRDGQSDGLREFWPMVRRAAGFIVRNGPATQQDRWEEDAGLSPFTLAAEIAALLAAAELAAECDEPAIAQYLQETADAWNDGLDNHIYVRGTHLARAVGVEGYYVRIAPPETADAASPAGGFVPIKNRPWAQPDFPAEHIVSPDALALVRFGLRSPHDPRIVDTVRVIDAVLKVETPFGPLWRRYNEDGYGEHEDGSAFDGTGIGRAWPLLTGERAHYELAAGNEAEAQRLLHTLEMCASGGGLLPEQIWDGQDVPERELFFGHPSGSAMPLVWAHAEYLKLRQSLREGRVFDMPAQTWQRYVIRQTASPYAFWRFNHKTQSIDHGRRFRIETLVPCIVHWSPDGWKTTVDSTSKDTGLGEHVVDLPTETLPEGMVLDFTFYWSESRRWEGVDFCVLIGAPTTPIKLNDTAP